MLFLFFNLLSTHILSEELNTPFGTLIGSNNGVPAYSNGDCDFISDEHYYIGDVLSGLKWQCVEYARRWIVLTQDLTFHKVQCASDIWHFNTLLSVSDDNKNVPLYRIPNDSPCPPSPGDLLIYKRGNDAPYGHIAIISQVYSDLIEISEQNWDNCYWPGNYSRTMPLTKMHDHYFLIDDEYPIIGWMSYKTPENLKCIDTYCLTCSSRDTSRNAICIYQ
ncbi:hypothetical protein SteCoe_32270 [Stentor coeruleus]|uniref:Peptidase C51 domain-containing protein n=1 Tax=Stentor coeruleus TaxID=5963 RepID=A0A1R2AZD4_9CILI|nr:hypothetical protein SteCoe_32270 [Stentor coeruleus]